MPNTTRLNSITFKNFKEETFEILDSERQILCKDKADFELRNTGRNLRNSSQKKISTLNDTKNFFFENYLDQDQINIVRNNEVFH
jgi:hypothetical protein